MQTVAGSYGGCLADVVEIVVWQQRLSIGRFGRAMLAEVGAISDRERRGLMFGENVGIAYLPLVDDSTGPSRQDYMAGAGSKEAWSGPSLALSGRSLGFSGCSEKIANRKVELR